MRRAKKIGFEILEDKAVKVFGGAYLKGNPKVKRPVSIKRSMHLVIRSTVAVGSKSFLKFDSPIQKIIRAQGLHFGVKVYRIANGGNHLHMILLPRSRVAFNGFIRSITGIIARVVLKAERGEAKGIQFWEKRPFTRVVEWGREFKSVSNYLLRNTLEALGFILYKPRSYPFKLIGSTA